MKNSATTTTYKLPLILPIIALSLALNLHALAGDSFWGDEILTASFASRSPAEVVDWTAEDIHPPLYYLLAGGFTRLIVPLGASREPGLASDWLWRFPSAITVVLTVAVTYRLALELAEDSRRAKPPLAALFAALLLCLAPVGIRYGQEARMHALFMFFSALSTWLFFRAWRRPQQKGRWLTFALVTAANLYTMYFGFLILAAQAGFLVAALWSRPVRSWWQSPALRYFSLAAGSALLLYLPWWPVLLALLRKRAAVGAIEGGVGSPLTFAGGVVKALGPLPAPVAWGFLLLFIAGLFFLARRNRQMALFAGLWLVLPVLLPVFLGDPRALQFRYAFVLPVYLAVVAYAVVCLAESQRVLKIFRLAPDSSTYLAVYLIWLLATFSFIGALGVYQLVKPNWREAAAYLDEHAKAADLIVFGPLWDEGRFIDYYYQGEAQLLTPAAMVNNIERRVEGLRAGGGRVWAVNRFEPTETAASKNVVFPGVVISEPQLAVYEPEILTQAAIELAAQAVTAAYPWAAAAEAQGILNPDPRTAKAAALRSLGDTFVAAGRPVEALEPYQASVALFPGDPNGFIALAETYEAVGDLPAAAAAYQQAIRFNLAWQGAEAKQAAALIEANNWPAALELYRAIIGN
jgi:uncharacterized membrane protein